MIHYMHFYLFLQCFKKDVCEWEAPLCCKLSSLPFISSKTWRRPHCHPLPARCEEGCHKTKPQKTPGHLLTWREATQECVYPKGSSPQDWRRLTSRKWDWTKSSGATRIQRHPFDGTSGTWSSFLEWLQRNRPRVRFLLNVDSDKQRGRQSPKASRTILETSTSLLATWFRVLDLLERAL